jgi:pyruvate/2-oxoglutarate dehydrogenase complex dihydrolipoamide acyltransferase (E2) component
VSDTTTTVVVPMPHMGVSVEEGTVVEWLKAVGDEVAEGDVICAIATDKVDVEVEAPAAGVLAKIVIDEGQTVPVGEPLAELAVGDDAAAAVAAAADAGGAVGGDSADATRRDSDDVSASAGGASRRVSGESPPTALRDSGADEARSSLQSHRGGKLNRAPGGESEVDLATRAAAGRDAFGRFDPAAAAKAVVSVIGSGGSNGSAKPASPVARRMARSHGIDLRAVKGSGRGGRVRKADVMQAISSGGAAGPVPSPAVAGPALGADGLPRGYEGVPHEVVETTRVRRAIAEHMSRSRQTAAHMTTEVDVDLSAVVRARTELNQARLSAGEAKLSYLPLIARATCVALGEHPDLNATFLGERMIRWQQVNLGVAVDTPEGLLVPVIPACDSLAAPAIGDAIIDLAERARTRKLVPDDLAGGTFTLSNPGSVGAVSAPAIINQPQVAILGVPTIQRRPWVIADELGSESIAIRPILRLAVTFDHRANDGAGATRFAVAVKDMLEAWGPEAYS